MKKSFRIGQRKPYPSKQSKKTNQPKEKKQQVLIFTHQFQVKRSDELLNFLLTKLSLSRNSIKALLTGHKVLVNGKVISQYNYPLAKEDEIKISKNPVRDPALQRSFKIKAASPFKAMIIYEDEDFVAINKPAGLLSVESDNERECAYAYAVDYFKSIHNQARPFLLHRIDKETSGVLVFAKSAKIQSMLRMHWNEDVKKREYIAIIGGKMKEKEGTYIDYLKEDENNLVYVGKGKDGKKAITHYWVMKESEKCSMLRVEIDTGRKNQIRVQLAHSGHPITNDDKYGDSSNHLNRLGLHASRLDFIHPITKKLMSFIAPIPQEFLDVFEEEK